MLSWPKQHPLGLGRSVKFYEPEIMGVLKPYLSRTRIILDGQMFFVKSLFEQAREAHWDARSVQKR